MAGARQACVMAYVMARAALAYTWRAPLGVRMARDATACATWRAPLGVRQSAPLGERPEQ